MLYGDTILWVCEWSNFAEKSSETTGGVVLSSFIDGPFASVVEGNSNYNNISLCARLYQCTESRIVVDHL
jgi:hypothetical protein